jgi:hypothetical protein
MCLLQKHASNAFSNPEELLMQIAVWIRKCGNVRTRRTDYINMAPRNRDQNRRWPNCLFASFTVRDFGDLFSDEFNQLVSESWAAVLNTAPLHFIVGSSHWLSIHIIIRMYCTSEGSVPIFLLLLIIKLYFSFRNWKK